MTKVKICGITNLRDARAAVAAGADFLGLNFYVGSPRCVTPEVARRIAESVKDRVKIVGVFVNESPWVVMERAGQVGLDYAQLHGDERPEIVAQVVRAVPVIKALQVQGALSAAELNKFRRASAVLLDGFHKSARGGTGKTFDWEVARRLGKGRRIFLAGGINAENAAEAIRVARPYAIDVCSGVETNTPRRKDKAKIAALMAAVRGSGNGGAKLRGRVGARAKRSKSK
jgi:phosphoribosylanthranilate isomerase